MRAHHCSITELAARWFLLALLGVALTGCAKLGYYTQAINGQLEILSKRQPIEALLDDPDTEPDLKARLASILEMRAFASRELGLPDNKSYRTYVDLKRPYVVWNVFATRELSVKPVEWCFAFIGCVSYRGYFSEKTAQKFAQKLREQDHDVYVAGIAAYSTLGWFHDPVLNTILRHSQTEIAGLIFHELAHQLTYVKDDTTFNESFAMTVELEGVRRWVKSQGSTEEYERYLVKKKRQEEFVNLITNVRLRLQEVYSSQMDDNRKRTAKAKAFEDLRADYKKLKESWGGSRSYDAWVAQELNNAHLIAIGLYHELVPAFHALLEQHDGDLSAFYGAVDQLGRLPREKRRAKLESLQAPDLSHYKVTGRLLRPPLR